MTEISIKEGDVFRFAYNERESEKRFEPYHCFDGQLIAKVKNDIIYLVDTYWNTNDNRENTVEGWEALGTLTYICNLHDITISNKDAYLYYSDNDVFNLSHQHGCYQRICIRKGAIRSKEKMLSSIKNAIKVKKDKIQYTEHELKRLLQCQQEIEAGNLDIYI